MATKQSKPTVIDVRKSGPIGYKALQYANQMGMTPAEEDLDYINQKVDYNYMPDQQNSIEATEDKSYTPSQLGVGEDIGTSSYDLPSYNADELEHYQNIRGEEQPWYAQAAAGIAKGGILAGTTFVDGTIGLVDGIYTAFNEGRVSGIWDNPITQSMAKINDWSEKALPNYYTEEEQNSPWYTNIFSANTIFDKMVKNLGFMVGATFSGGVYAKGLSLGARALGKLATRASALTKGVKVTDEMLQAGANAMDASNASRATKSVIGSFMNAEAEGTVEAVNNSNDWVKNQKQKYDDLTKQELEKAQEEYLLTRGKSMISTGDGRMVDPAYIKYQNRIAELQKAKDAAYAQIDKDRTKMGNADLLMNLPILFLGDMVTFGKMYAGGWKAARNQMKTTTKATKEALNAAKKEAAVGNPEAMEHLQQVVQTAKKTGYQGLSVEDKALVEEVANKGFDVTSPFESIANSIGKKTGITYAALRQPLKEGNEEMLQAAASRAAGSYYQDDVDNIYSASLDPEAKQKTLSWLSAIGKGLKDEYSDINNYEEGFIGALTGALGAPTFTKNQNRTDQTWLGRNKFIGLSGGVVTDVRDYLKDRADEQLTVEHINSVLHDSNFKNRFNHFVAQTKFDEDKKEAVVNDDQKAYKDADTASIFEDIMYFKKGNRLDLLQRALDNTELFDENDIQDIISQVSSQRSAVNANINTDIAKRKDAETRLTQAQQDLDSKYGEESTRKAMEVFEQMGGANNESAIDFLDQFTEGKKAQEQYIDSIQQEVDNYTNRINNSNSIEYSPYMKSDGTMMSDDEVKEDIQKRVQHTKDIINDISKAQDEIDNATGGAYTDEQLTTLTWYKVMMRDWERRASKMAGGIKEFIQLAVDDPVLNNTLKALQGNEKISEGNILYGGFLQHQKSSGEDIINNILNKLVDLSPEETNTDTGKAKLGVALAQVLNSDKIVPITTTRIENEKEVKETKQQKLGDFVKEKLSSFIDDSILYSDDQKAPFKKALNDLVKIGDNYSQYEKLLQEFRKNPEKIEEAHTRTENKAAAAITNKNAKTIAERFNWNAPIGEIASVIDNNQGDIDNMGGLKKFIKSLPKEQQEKVKQAQKLREAISSMHDYIDESDLEDNIKNLAKTLIDEATPNASDLQSLATAIQDSINEGAIQNMADALIDSDTDERIKDDLLQKSEEELTEFFNDKVKKIADALDKQERQNVADEAREQKIKEDLDNGRIPNNDEEPISGNEAPDEEGPSSSNVPKENEPASAPSEELSIGDSFTLKDKADAPTYKITGTKLTGKKKQYVVTNNKTGKTQTFDTDYVNKRIGTKYSKISKEPNNSFVPQEEGKGPQGNNVQKENEPQADGKLYEENKQTSKSEWQRVNNNKESGPIQEGSKGKERRRQITEYYLHGLDSETYVQHIKEHPEDISNGVDKEAFIKYVEAIHTYLKEHDAFNYVANHLQKGDKITFTVDEELTKKAGTPVVLMTVESKTEKNDDGTPKIQVIGSIRSELDFQIYDETVKEDSKKKNKSIEAQRELYKEVLKRATTSTPTITEVESLMAGELPISKNENSLSEIFGDKTPIIGIVYKSNLITGKKEVDENTQVPSISDGQVYVMIPSHNGKYIPARCYSTPINSLSDTDWYMQEAVKALMNTTTSTANMGSNTQEFKKWIPLKNLHINFVTIGERDGKTFWNQTDDKSKATHLQLRFENKEGKSIIRTLKLNNGELKENSALDFIRAWAGALTLNTTVNKNRLNDTDYINHMASYIHTNLVRGEMGQHTRDDWFTYTPTDIERQSMNAGVKQSPADPTNKPQGSKPALSTQGITYKGQEYQVASDGQVSLNGEPITDKALAQSVRDALNNTVKSSTVIDLGENKPKGTSVFAAFASGPSLSGLGGRTPRRGSAKHLESSRVIEEIPSTEAQRKEAERITKQLFPALANSNRIVLVQGIIHSIDEKGNPVEAFGAFKDGILYISDKAPKGTAYHEAFHYVTDFLLNEEEKKQMFDAAREQYGNLEEIELEEKLAEDFRTYMNGYKNPSLKQRIKNFFKNLANLIMGVKENPQYLDTLFYSIARGKMSNRKEHYTSTTKNMVETAQQYEKRLQDILDKAPRNKEGKLLAPNGKVSNLTERQYAQVRTQEFKDWFGDWQNDPQNASKVVDENGEPLVVYRAGEMENGTIKTTYKGYYFTPSRGMAESYSKQYNLPVSEFFINAKTINSPRSLSIVTDSAGNKKPYRGLFEMPWNKEDVAIVLDNKEAAYSEGEYLVGNLNQIKSATDNIGTFSNNNNTKYLKADTFETDLMKHRVKKFSYDNLSQEEKEYLGLRHISEQDYKNLSTKQQEILLHCM